MGERHRFRLETKRRVCRKCHCEKFFYYSTELHRKIWASPNTSAFKSGSSLIVYQRESGGGIIRPCHWKLPFGDHKITEALQATSVESLGAEITLEQGDWIRASCCKIGKGKEIDFSGI